MRRVLPGIRPQKMVCLYKNSVIQVSLKVEKSDNRLFEAGPQLCLFICEGGDILCNSVGQFHQSLQSNLIVISTLKSISTYYFFYDFFGYISPFQDIFKCFMNQLVMPPHWLQLYLK